MGLCAIETADKRALGKAVGEDLLQQHGKKRFYSVKEVQESVNRNNFPMDWSCWAYCVFTSPEDFSTYHASIGESCEYGVMKAEMVSAMTDGASTSWFDTDMSWLEWPDVDLSAIFESIDLS